MGFSVVCPHCSKRLTSKKALQKHQRSKGHSHGIRLSRVDAVGYVLISRNQYRIRQDGLLGNTRGNALQQRSTVPRYGARPSPAALLFLQHQLVKRAVEIIEAQRQVDDIVPPVINPVHSPLHQSVFAAESEGQVEAAIRHNLAVEHFNVPVPKSITMKEINDALDVALIEKKRLDDEKRAQKQRRIIANNLRIEQIAKEQAFAKTLRGKLYQGIPKHLQGTQSRKWDRLPLKVKQRGIRSYQRRWWTRNVICGRRYFRTPGALPTLSDANTYIKSLAFLSEERVVQQFEFGVAAGWVLPEDQDSPISDDIPILPPQKVAFHSPSADIGHYAPIKATIFGGQDSDEYGMEQEDSNFLRKLAWNNHGQKEDQEERQKAQQEEDLRDLLEQYLGKQFQIHRILRNAKQ